MLYTSLYATVYVSEWLQLYLCSEDINSYQLAGVYVQYSMIPRYTAVQKVNGKQLPRIATILGCEKKHIVRIPKFVLMHVERLEASFLRKEWMCEHKLFIF